MSRSAPDTLARRYGAEFYEGQRDGALSSARVVVPLILDLLQVGSVCDVGCGVAPWLRAFRESGVADVVGLDGGHVDAAMLQIPAELFLPRDLAQPILLDRYFDLAVSLEVAEHLPPARAAGFVHDLTALAPIILFSAAIPGQGGRNHVNEQWPDYWARLFAERDYVPADVIRPAIWDDEAVEWWYRQNTILYCAAAQLPRYPRLAAAAGRKGSVRAEVHPLLYLNLLQMGRRWHRRA